MSGGASAQARDTPVCVRIPQSRLSLIRAITLGVVVGPAVGSAACLGLWLHTGVRPASLWALVIAYSLGTLGVTIGYHRYFAHRSFSTSSVMKVFLAVLGSMAFQGSLLYWVSTHRRHHQFSDTPQDPHSPHFCGARQLGGWSGLWHGHIGWMFSPEVTNAIRFAPELIRDPLVFAVQRRYGLWAFFGLTLPPLVTAAFVRDPVTLLQVFLAAGPLRLFLVHNASWAVGSVSHLAGRRPFDTQDRSANNFWVALFAFGEGLQNNHHAFPRAAHHAFHWWEPDLTGLILRLLEAIRVIWDVNRPSTEALAARRRPPRVQSQGDVA